MTIEPSPPSTTPFHDARTSHIERLDWLERSLRDQVPLPRFEPDEFPAVALLRFARSLPERDLDGLRRGARELVERFAFDPKREANDEAYVRELLALTRGLGFGLHEVGPALSGLMREPARALALPGGQAQRVLATLVDLRAYLPADTLEALVRAAPERFGVLALTHALRGRPGDVPAALRALPDRQGTADATWATLTGHAEHLTDDERKELAALLSADVDRCAPAIRAAVREWLAEQPAATPGPTSLDTALLARRQRRGEPYARDAATPKLPVAA